MGVQHFSHTQLAQLRKDSEKLAPDLSDIGQIIASNDGYVLTQDERILLRFAVGSAPVNLWRSETKSLGLDVPGVRPQEAYAYVSRLAQLDFIESAAIRIQRKAVLLERALQDMVLAAQAGKMPTPKQIVAATVALREAAE